MKYQRAAFSLVELIIIVTFLSILAFIAIPRLNYALISKQKAEATAWKIVTDLRLTRRLAISDAANNVKGFELSLFGSVPYHAYQIKNLNTNKIISSHTTDSAVILSAPIGIRYSYTPLGNLKPASANKLIVSAEGRSFTINVNPATGIVKCVEN